MEAGRALDEDEPDIARFVAEHGDRLRGDPRLLEALGLRLSGPNVVEFGPIALSRISAERAREESERKRLEAMARANFAAQAQTHAAVIDLLEARNHPDLARRVDDLARLRFGLAAGVLAMEGPPPPGWGALVPGQVDLTLGAGKLARLGCVPTAHGLFGELAPAVGSVALVRLAIWEPAHQGLLAFASLDAETFTADMGSELVSFIARVLERTAERWPPP